MGRKKNTRARSGVGWSVTPDPSSGSASGSTSGSPSRAQPKKTSRRGGPTVPTAPDDGIVRVWRQTKGRRGKGATVVTGLGLADAELTALAKALKALCGSGGTAKDGVLELQGDHRDRVIDALRARGFRVKKAGG